MGLEINEEKIKTMKLQEKNYEKTNSIEGIHFW